MYFKESKVNTIEDSLLQVSGCSDEAVAARGSAPTRHRLGGRRYTTKAMEKRHDIGGMA